jgi:hypothetical protein
MRPILFCLSFLVSIGCGDGQSVGDAGDTGERDGERRDANGTDGKPKVEAGHDATMSDTGGACVPGHQINCECPGGRPTGVQVCLPTGIGYGGCACSEAAVDAAHPKDANQVTCGVVHDAGDGSSYPLHEEASSTRAFG